MVEGTVDFWNDDEGWGVLSSPEVPGEVWAHFSHITEGDESGYRSLNAGDRVQFEWEDFPSGQDGYFYRARHIERLDGPEGGSGLREPRRPRPPGGGDVIELSASETDNATD